jgi:hypothetical protein
VFVLVLQLVVVAVMLKGLIETFLIEVTPVVEVEGRYSPTVPVEVVLAFVVVVSVIQHKPPNAA